MELSKRLAAVAGLVSYPTVADIGKGPLEICRANIALYGAEGVIETRLGNGLVPLRPFEVETAVMAGMGGMLTVHILEDSPEVALSLKELVLSPQHDSGAVRKCLHKIGFSIAEEHMLKEDGKLYTLMRCERGTERYDREIDYLYGKRLLEKKEPLLREVLEIEKGKYQRLAEQLRRTETENARLRLPAVEEKLEGMKEALGCWQK